jgi:hypothetical protein
LTPQVSDRGFTSLPALPSTYGGEVRAYESSSAEGPHIWLNVSCPEDLNNRSGVMKEAVAHMTAEDAKRLGEQLLYLVEFHYQARDI